MNESTAHQKLIEFRKQLYQLFPKRSDAIMNLLDAISSHAHACESIVSLSEAAAFTRQYSSITDAIAGSLPSAQWDKIKQLVYYEQHACAYNAIQREKQLKRWKRQWKLNLIEGFNPN